MKSNEIFLETAHRIGQRIARQAIWDGNACTWQIMRPDTSQPGSREAVVAIAGGGIYQGTAGIALFLAELYRYALDPGIRNTAEGALQYTLNEAATLPEHSFSFYAGRVGAAFTSARLGVLFEVPELLAEASRLLAPLPGNEHLDQGIDVIAGAAGAIPALLQLANMLDEEMPLSIAIALGDHLIRIAHREPVGWSWGTLHIPPFRNLLGYAHGAAGIGHALLELYHVTKSNAYLYAAEQAFFYERQYFDEQEGNWPDFRHHLQLFEYVGAGLMEEAKALVRSGSLPPYDLKFMNAWCHGAPGIGLSRLRAFEVLQNTRYQEEATLAIRATIASLQEAGNYSLCHGVSGNCETLLYATDVLDEPRFREIAEISGLNGLNVFEKEKRPWPCGTTGEITDPSLMLGEGGIGYFYLRLYSLKTPSLLLLCAPDKVSVRKGATVSYQTLQRKYVELYFGRTLRVLEAIRGNQLDVSIPLEIPIKTSDVTRVYDLLVGFIKEEREYKGASLADAFLPERIRYEMTLTLDDFSEEYIERLTHLSAEDLNWHQATFQLASDTYVLESQWDWDSWLTTKDTTNAPRPHPVYFLLHRFNNRIHIRQIGLFASLVLQQLKTPSSLHLILSKVMNAVEPRHSMDPELVQERIIDQLQEVHRMGVVTCQPLTENLTPA